MENSLGVSRDESLDKSLDESRVESRDESFFNDLSDELVWERLLAVDPALPEYLGDTVILLGKMRTMVREVGHAVKGKHG